MVYTITCTVPFYSLITAPVCGILINKFSCRTSIVAGGIITAMGYTISAFVESLDVTILTAGVLVGKTWAYQPQSR